jgi:hypothetical protein
MFSLGTWMESELITILYENLDTATGRDRYLRRLLGQLGLELRHCADDPLQRVSRAVHRSNFQSPITDSRISYCDDSGAPY